MINTIKPHIIKEEVKPILKKVSLTILRELCDIIHHKFSPIGGYDEIYEFLKKEFLIDCTLDDVIKVYSLEICETENELLYKQYGH